MSEDSDRTALCDLMDRPDFHRIVLFDFGRNRPVFVNVAAQAFEGAGLEEFLDGVVASRAAGELCAGCEVKTSQGTFQVGCYYEATEAGLGLIVFEPGAVVSRNLLARLFDQLQEVTSDVIYVTEATTGRTMYVSENCERVLGYRRQDVQGFGRDVWLTLVHPDDRGMFERHFEKVLTWDKARPAEIEYRIVKLDGAIRTMRSREQIVRRGKDGKALEILGIVEDFTQRRLMMEQLEHFALKAHDSQVRLEFQAYELEALNHQLAETNAQLKHASLTDGLTGAYNRRALDELITKAFAETGGTGAVIVFDVDHFKGLNDAHGHLAGDEVLKTLVELVWREARGTDKLARYGGEEFVVYDRDGSASGMVALAERIRGVVERHPWAYGPVTVSLGVAEFEEGMVSPLDLISVADRALYDAKSNGRNQVVVAEQRTVV